jgi:hypothetical protein
MTARACLHLKDAVEKVRGIPRTRNNRIIGVDFLNRTCAFDAHFESISLGDPPKIFFRQHRPIRDVPSAAYRAAAIEGTADILPHPRARVIEVSFTGLRYVALLKARIAAMQSISNSL